MSRKIVIGRELTANEISLIRYETEVDITCFEDISVSFDAKIISLSADEKREINYSTLGEIIGFGDKILKGQSLAKHLQFGRSSIWHYHKFRTYFFVRNLNYELAKLKKAKVEKIPVDFYCTSEFQFLQQDFPNINFIFTEKKKEPINWVLAFKYLIFLKLRIVSSIFTRFLSSDILIYYPERYNPLLNLKTLEPKDGNFLLDYLFTQSKSPLNLIGEVPVPKLKSKAGFPLQSGYFKTKESGHPKKNMESILARYGWSAWRQAKKEGNILKQKYIELLTEPLSLNEKLALRFVQSLHSSSVFYLTRYFAARKFFSKHRFRVLLATDENSPLTKSVIDAAKDFGVKTVGMQHGTMHDLHPAYLYTKEDVRQGIIPDYTLTWGTYWEKFLIEKGNYPAEKVTSVGHLRTDIIPKLLEKKSPVSEKFHLVFASQPQRDPVLRRQAAFDVFSATRKFSDIELVVKLHPREYDEVEYYCQIAREADCSNFRIDKNTDLYELIASCDALITCFSTVGTETVYFSKPLIILDHLMQDIQGYYKEGAAFRAVNAAELEQTISGLKNGELQLNEAACKTFIEKYSYRIDGKVAERISDFLQSIS